MRIAFAGGGTGGHVFPVRSLIQHIETHPEYKEKAEKLVRFGERGSLEESIAGEFSDVEFVRIVSGKIRRGASIGEWIRNIGDMFVVIWGIVESLRKLSTRKIDVIFCKGGYVSLPVVIAGRMLRKRIVMHESDAKSGLSNKICAKFATTIFTGFSGVFPGREIVVGQILSSDLIKGLITNDQGPINQGDEKTQILVTGGSQGAESVYRPLAQLIRKNGYVKSHFYVVLGTKNSGLRSLFEGLENVTCYDFVSQAEMGGLLAKCDVAITRAGTTSMAEQKLFGLKLVMVPIPWTHDQLLNAVYYEKHFNDMLVKQDESFLLSLPIALEKVQGWKKNWTGENIEKEVSKAKETICEKIFRVY